MKPRSALTRCVGTGALVLSLAWASVLPARAQGGLSVPSMSGVLCERLLEMARSAQQTQGANIDAALAMAGCTPAGAAPGAKPGAAPLVVPVAPNAWPTGPAAAVGAKATAPGSNTDKVCQSIADAMAGGLQNDAGYWLGPMPVLFARTQAERCPDAVAGSPAQQRLQEGLLRFSSGRFDDSVAAMREGLALPGLPPEMAMRLHAEIAKSLLATGQHAPARASIEQAQAALDKSGSPAAAAAAPAPQRALPGPGQWQELMANAAREQERADAVERRQQVQTELRVLMGVAALQANDVEGALAQLREANAIVQQRGESAVMERGIVSPYLALALQRAGRLDEARAVLDGALAGREDMLGIFGAGPSMMASMQRMGVAAPPVAQRNFDAGAMMSGEMFLPGFACPLLEQVQAQANRPEQALEAAERCRGRALATLLANRAFHKPAPTLPELMARAERSAREPDRERSTSDMRRDFMDNPAAEAASQPARIADIRRMAAERRATVLVYSIATTANQLPNRMPDRETGIRVWVVSPDGRVTLRERAFAGVLDSPGSLQDDTYPLSAAVLRAREVFGVAGRGPVAVVSARPQRVSRSGNELRRLYRLLIDPVADLLPAEAGARLLVVPQGALFLVPFAALEDAAGAPLLARYTLSFAPSMQTLALTRLRQHPPESAAASLIVGNPVMPRYTPVAGGPPLDVPDLPGAEEEARAIGVLLKTAPLTGAAATKPAVLGAARQARYIHLATHGFLDDFTERNQREASPYVRSMTFLGGGEDPDAKTPGLLALAPSSGDGGMLTADEIAEASTQAELVVMSACDTGRGAINDEGVIGLSRAWMAAGAPSVLVSLWSIPDEPTRDLMVHFYGRLQAGSGKAEALREAMLATRAKYPKTAYWAAFVLMGEPQ